MDEPQPQQPVQVPGTLPLTVTLQAAVWQQLLGFLAEQPFRSVGPLIGEIERQCQPQIELHLRAPPRANGEIRADA